MTPTTERTFHPGELKVQRRAGVRQLAARLEGMLETPDLTGGLSRFLAGRTYAALSARDRDSRLWVSPLAGDPGFLEVLGPTRLRIHAGPTTGDPLHEPPVGQAIGLLVIEYAIRRRVRINGRLIAATARALDIEISEAFGNCPQYIPPHALAPIEAAGREGQAAPEPRTTLTATDLALIARADTFVLGTTHATRGNDASHRGGPPGFVHVDQTGTTLTWPDYPGNNLFNSLGNLTLDPTAALLFADFTTGATLHLTGTAETTWNQAHHANNAADAAPADTGRTVVFHLGSAVSGPPLAVRLIAASP